MRSGLMPPCRGLICTSNVQQRRPPRLHSMNSTLRDVTKTPPLQITTHRISQLLNVAPLLVVLVAMFPKRRGSNTTINAAVSESNVPWSWHLGRTVPTVAPRLTWQDPTQCDVRVQTKTNLLAGSLGRKNSRSGSHRTCDAQDRDKQRHKGR